MGKKMEAYYDKKLGKWVFPDGDDAEDNDSSNHEPPTGVVGGNGGNFPERNGPPMNVSSSSGPPSSSLSRSRRQPRYATFGVNVTTPTENTNKVLANHPPANMPPGTNNNNMMPMIPGAF